MEKSRKFVKHWSIALMINKNLKHITLENTAQQSGKQTGSIHVV